MELIKNIIILLFYFLCTQVFAQQDVDNALDKINNSFAITITGLNLGYKEINLTSQSTNGTQPKSTESGTIPGFTFDMKYVFTKIIYTDFYFDYYRGKLKYDGSTQLKESYPPYIATYNPVISYSEHIFLTTHIKTGFIFAINESFQTIPYIGVGYRYWNRANHEEYQHGNWIAGLKLDWLLADNFVLSPYFEMGKLFAATMEDHHNISYELINKPIYAIGLELNYEINNNLFLNTFVNYTHFEYGKSVAKYDSIDNKYYYEPDSKTNEVKFGLGLRF
jgi:hypothetical protein